MCISLNTLNAFTKVSLDGCFKLIFLDGYAKLQDSRVTKMGKVDG